MIGIDKYMEIFKSVVFNSDGKVRKVLYILLTILLECVVYKISDYMQFGAGAIGAFMLCALFICTIGYLCTYQPSGNERELGLYVLLVAGIIGVFSLIICSGTTHHEKIEKHRPSFVAHTEYLTIVQDGTQVLHTDNIVIYKEKNPMLCKKMIWNHYNYRLTDEYYICK